MPLLATAGLQELGHRVGDGEPADKAMGSPEKSHPSARWEAFDGIVYLVGFAESLPTPEVCFSLRKECARIVCFARLKTREKFAQLSFVNYAYVNAPEDNLNQAIEDVTALIICLRPALIMVSAMMRRS